MTSYFSGINIVQHSTPDYSVLTVSLNVEDHSTQILKEDNILIKERLGIREAANGERKEQLKYAQQRINEIGALAEEGDKDLFTKIDDLAACMSTGSMYPIGKVWCADATPTYNPDWLKRPDDGIT